MDLEKLQDLEGYFFLNYIKMVGQHFLFLELLMLGGMQETMNLLFINQLLILVIGGKANIYPQQIQ